MFNARESLSSPRSGAPPCFERSADNALRRRCVCVRPREELHEITTACGSRMTGYLQG